MKISAFVAALCPILLSPFLSGGARDHKFFYYVSPLPGSEYVPRETTLIFRPTEELILGYPQWRSSIEVVGSRSGRHGGEWIESDDGMTYIYKPFTPFVFGERVGVRFSLKADGTAVFKQGETSFSFMISPRRVDARTSLEELLSLEYGDYPSIPATTSDKRLPYERKERKMGYKLPDDFPPIEVTSTGDPGEGYIFLAPFAPYGSTKFGYYIVIVDNQGTPYFFRKMGHAILDFKKQPNGLLTYFEFTRMFYALDNSYTVVDSFYAKNGYQTDGHDLQILPDGHALLIADDRRIVDMSKFVQGGDTAAVVIGSVIQELDKSKNVVFQWRTFDYLPITDSYVELTRHRIRYTHVNSVELDYDGNILISVRHLSEITKIDRTTGNLIWRMGGKGNQFTLVNDTSWFSFQHSVRRLPNGHITVFDNGNLNTPKESRAVEYELDEESKVATLVWEYRHDPPLFSFALGSVQRLEDGSSVICWGGVHPNITELSEDGSKALEVDLLWLSTYRAFRFDWHGVAAAPYLWADSTGGRITLYFTKFGDRKVRRYRIYRGDTSNEEVLADSTMNPFYVLSDYDPGDTLYFQVSAIDRRGAESPRSNEVVVVTPWTAPPLLKVGLDISPATLNVRSQGGPILAKIFVPPESGHTADDIEKDSVFLNGDVEPDGFIATRGQEAGRKCNLYVEFPRSEVIETLPEADSCMIVVTGRIGKGAFEGVDTVRVIGWGGYDDDGDKKERESIARLYGGSPNPFNPYTVVTFELPADIYVSLNIYSVEGKLVRNLLSGPVAEGVHSVRWDGLDNQGRRAASGIYFCRLVAGDGVSSRKLLLLK